MLNYNGLYGDNAKAILPDFIHCESIKTRSQKHDWEIKQHIHTALFQIFCIEKGSGKLLIEQKKFDFEDACLLIIPENTLHGFEYEEEIQGTVLTISVSFLEQLFKQKPNVSLELGKLRILNLDKNDSDFQFILQCIEKIKQEIFSHLPERETMLQALFTAFLTNIFRFTYIQNEEKIIQNERSLRIFKLFVEQIKKIRKPQRLISEYAQELKITPIHLNRICQYITQKTATQVVNDFFVGEAQKLLRHTSFGISEIAYQLNFEDAAYFSRLFKKHTGASPKEFRENN
ncbi:MAG: helix-turn-helix domain-containing protein [Arcicella sp.]|nr:helix-turn-helix domain-containing protein [Arcicella sp.]